MTKTSRNLTLVWSEENWLIDDSSAWGGEQKTERRLCEGHAKVMEGSCEVGLGKNRKLAKQKSQTSDIRFIRVTGVLVPETRFQALFLFPLSKGSLKRVPRLCLKVNSITRIEFCAWKEACWFIKCQGYQNVKPTYRSLILGSLHCCKTDSRNRPHNYLFLDIQDFKRERTTLMRSKLLVFFTAHCNYVWTYLCVTDRNHVNL